MAWSDLDVQQVDAVSTKWFDKGKMTDQVYDSNVILDRIKKGDRVIVTGGNSISHTVKLRELGQAKMIDPDAARQTVVYDTRSAVRLDWKWAVCDIVMTWEEKVKNRGEPEIINLLRSKYEEGMQDMDKLISTQFHQAYTSVGSYDMQGFYSAVRTSGTAYGGIDSDDASEWAAGLYDTSTTTMALYGTGSLDAGVRACWFRDPPNLILTTRANASIYASKLQPGERRQPQTGKAGAPQNVLYFQGIPVVPDPQANANSVAFLNTDYLFLYVQSGENFEYGGWEEDPDRYEAIRSLFRVVGNFVFTRRKAFGAYTAIAS
jgi:hypothetical protein